MCENVDICRLPFKGNGCKTDCTSCPMYSKKIDEEERMKEMLDDFFNRKRSRKNDKTNSGRV